MKAAASKRPIIRHILHRALNKHIGVAICKQRVNMVGHKHTDYSQKLAGHDFVIGPFKSADEYRRYVQKLGETACHKCAGA